MKLKVFFSQCLMSEQNMTLHNDKQFLDQEGLAVLVDEVKRYNEGCDTLLQSNINTMYPFVPLSAAELETTDRVREIIREYNQIPCTKCRYCAEVCPKNVPIADLFAVYNEYALAKVTKKETKAGLNSFDVKAGDCIECGKCEKICPQNIEIREKLKKLKKRCFFGKT